MSTIELQENVREDHWLAERMRSIFLGADSPLTTRDIAGRIGKLPGYRIVNTLEDLTQSGSLARFRIGLNHYYATPRIALTQGKPHLKTVVSDSLKSIFRKPD